MIPRIELLSEKKLVGCHEEMSLSDDKTAQLWQNFGPRIKELGNRVSADKISLQIFPPKYHQKFNPSNVFIKWTAVEVGNFNNTPKGLDTLILSQGEYAVFDYKGRSSDQTIFEYIFKKWLPNSKYYIDNRPHFEVLGINYNNLDASSEEEIWIPIRTNKIE
ncbi:MAG: GyrI-like domain-containing protein [Cryomorphaceae bacterium]|nr:GyrI-like domain-containing protein [Cryomorphaceae bacterium]